MTEVTMILYFMVCMCICTCFYTIQTVWKVYVVWMLCERECMITCSLPKFQNVYTMDITCIFNFCEYVNLVLKTKYQYHVENSVS